MDASIHGLLVGRDGQVGIDAKRVLRRRQDPDIDD